MGRAFINSLIVTIPATILPILFAAFAGYAFAWLDFKGRFLPCLRCWWACRSCRCK